MSVRSSRPAIALLAVLALACKDSSTSVPKLATINVAAANAALASIGATTQLTATGKDASGAAIASTTVTWTTSAPAVATVSTAGLVTAVGNGTAVITATSGTVTGTVTITVAQVAATITVSPGTNALDAIGKTANLTATAKDAGGNAMTATLIWTTSDPKVATVSTAGVVTSTGPGSATITVAAGTVNATAALTVTVTRFGYAWADQLSATTAYAPSSRYALNATGGGMNINRLSAGRYQVTFGGMAKRGATETVIVTAYGSPIARCIVESWSEVTSPSDLDIFVACVSPAGAALDSRFTILVVGNGTLPGRLGFAWANDATTTTYTPNAGYSHSSTGGALTATRSAAGSYQMRLNVPKVATDPPENYFVTAYGSTAAHCKTVSWSFGTSVDVVCYNNAGALTDSRYNTLMLSSGRTGARYAFGWSFNAAPVTPNDIVGTYGRTSSGSSILVSKTSTGNYNVTFTGLATPANKTETIAVTSYGSEIAFCRVSGWSNSGNDLVAGVTCTDPAGTALDARFTILLIE